MTKILLSKLPFTGSNSEGTLIQTIIDSLKTLEILGAKCVNVLEKNHSDYNEAYFQANFHFLKLAEGFKNKAYLDEAANPPVMTIGIGYNLDQSGARAVISEQLHLDYDALRAGRISLTDGQVAELLRISLIARAKALKERLSIGNLLEHSFKAYELLALQSMAFTNSHLIGSRLMKNMHESELDAVAIEIIEYSNLQNHVGIANRRLKELALFLGDAHEAKLTWRGYQKLAKANSDVKVQGPIPRNGLPFGHLKDDFSGHNEKKITLGLDNNQVDHTVYGSKNNDEHIINTGHQVVFGGEGDDIVEVKASARSHHQFLALNKGVDQYSIDSNCQNIFIYDVDGGLIKVANDIIIGFAEWQQGNSYTLRTSSHIYSINYLHNDETLHETLLIQEKDQPFSIYLSPYKNGLFDIYLTKTMTLTNEVNFYLEGRIALNYFSNDNLALTYYQKLGYGFRIITDIFDSHFNRVGSIIPYSTSSNLYISSAPVYTAQTVLENDLIAYVLQGRNDETLYVEVNTYHPTQLGLVSSRTIVSDWDKMEIDDISFEPLALALKNGGLVVNYLRSFERELNTFLGMELAFLDANLNFIHFPISLIDPFIQVMFNGLEYYMFSSARKIVNLPDDSILFFYLYPSLVPDSHFFQLNLLKLSSQGQILNTQQFGQWTTDGKMLQDCQVEIIAGKMFVQMMEVESLSTNSLNFHEHSMYQLDFNTLMFSRLVSFIPPRSFFPAFPVTHFLHLGRNNGYIQFTPQTRMVLQENEEQSWLVKFNPEGGQEVKVLSYTRTFFSHQMKTRWKHDYSKTGSIARASISTDYTGNSPPTAYIFQKIELSIHESNLLSDGHHGGNYFARNMQVSQADNKIPSLILFYFFVGICMLSFIKGVIGKIMHLTEEKETTAKFRF